MNSFHNSQFSTAGMPLDISAQSHAGLLAGLGAFALRLRTNLASLFWAPESSQQSKVTHANDKNCAVIVSARIGQLIANASLLSSAGIAEFTQSEKLVSQLPQFLEKIHSQLDALDELVRVNDPIEAGKVAHRMIGSTWLMGAAALSTYASQIDEQIRTTRQWPTQPYWMETFWRLFEMTTEKFKPYCAHPRHSSV